MTLEQLFNTPRMGHAPLDNLNSVRGLFEIIANFFEPHFKMVEVGSFEGVSTILFSRFVDTVYSVDCYDYPVPPTGRIPTHDQLFVDAEKTFIERTKDIKNIVKIRKSSEEAARDFPDHSLDVIYIDAEHDENSVRSDINAWRSKVKYGGYLCGHDYVQESVRKVVAEQGFANISVAPDSSWIVKIPSIALVAVASTKVPETIEAMRKCQAQFSFTKSILCTHEDIAPEGIEIVKTEKLDYEGYNRFVAMELWKHVDADYVILCQNDGYILNGQKWESRWLEYDYIGAPWPIPEDDKTYRTPSGQLVRVGNGGFTLRSRKLLRAPSILGLTFTDNGTGFPHEDGFLCVHNRDELEKNGIKFAPLEIALKFSRELPVPERTDNDTFGFHKYL